MKRLNLGYEEGRTITPNVSTATEQPRIDIDVHLDLVNVSASTKALLADPLSAGLARVLTIDSNDVLGQFDQDRLDRLRESHGASATEEELLESLEFCRFGTDDSPPSIDTGLHAFVAGGHIRHSHPVSILAMATAVDGQSLTKECLGDEFTWIPWRRPGLRLGLDLADAQSDHPDAVGAVLEGHGLLVWGETGEEALHRQDAAIQRAEAFVAERLRPSPFGRLVHSRMSGSEPERRRRAAWLAPVLRGLVSTDRPMVAHFTDSDRLLDFIGSSEGPRLADLGTPYPEHVSMTKPFPLFLDSQVDDPVGDVVARARRLHGDFRERYQHFYKRYPRPESPVMRSCDPTVVLVPGVGMFTFGEDKRAARRTGEVYCSAIQVMAGAESLSAFAPAAEAEVFQVEHGPFEESRLQRMPKRKPLTGRIALVTGAASGIGKATAERLAAEGASVVVADRNMEGAEAVASQLGPDVAIWTGTDITDEEAVQELMTTASISFGGLDLVVNNAGLSISKPLLETDLSDWDVQHDVMARGSFLVSKEAARVMISQGMGGDIVYIVSKNGVFAGPNNVAYASAKADQAHQVRLLAAELGEHGIRVNGVNPDAVVRGSGIFASGWGAERAAIYGVEEEDLGRFYAQRTLLKREVLPEHVAAAVFTLTAGDLSWTTGTHIPVDGGMAAAFLR